MVRGRMVRGPHDGDKMTEEDSDMMLNFGQVSQRFRFFLKLFLPALILVSGISAVFWSLRSRGEEALVRQRIVGSLDVASGAVSGNFKAVVSDIKFLVNTPSLRKTIEKEGAKALGELRAELQDFMSGKEVYDQISYRNEKGREVVRIENVGGVSLAVAGKRSENQGDFSVIAAPERGEIHLSPLAFDIKGGKVERPLKPIILFSVSLFDKSGKKRGTLTLRYKAAGLFSDIKASFETVPGEPMLLNKDGFWIQSGNEKDIWGFILKNGESFAKRYPEEWRRIKAEQAGTLKTGRGLFVYKSIYPLHVVHELMGGMIRHGEGPGKSDLKRLRWIFVSRYENVGLMPLLGGNARAELAIYALLILFSAFVSWYLAGVRDLRVSAEKKLSQFKSTLDQTKDCIFMFRPDTLKFFYVNQGAVDQVRYSREELMEMSPIDIKPEFDEARFRKMISLLVKGPVRSLTFQTLHERKSGIRIPVEVSLQYVFPTGEEPRFVSFVRDISDQKRTEKDIREKSNLLETLNRVQSQYIATGEAFSLFEQILGETLILTSSEYGFIGEVFYGDDGKPFLVTHAVSTAARKNKDDEKGGKALLELDALVGGVIKDGRPVVVNKSEKDSLLDAYPILDAFMGIPLYSGSELVGVAGLANRPGGYDEKLLTSLEPFFRTCANIIAGYRNELRRSEAEEELRKSEAGLAASQHLAHIGSLEWDFKTGETYWSDELYRILGHEPQAFPPGKEAFLEVIAPGDRKKVSDVFDSGPYRTGRYSLEFRIIRASGEIRHLGGQGKTTFDQAGNPVGMNLIVQDVTEHNKIERLQKEFISTVSHELRTPLTSIIGALGLIKGGAGSEMPEKVKKMVEIAYSNSERLSRLINDILDMEKIESGKMEFKMAPLDVQALTEKAIEENKGYGEKHKVRFNQTESLPGVLIMGDVDRLLQVYANLLSNAAKYSPKGENVDVSVTRRNGGLIRLSVTDRGPGIPKEFRKQIFHKFSRADTSDARQKDGTGLGLSITRAIIEKHKGKVGFETEKGKGATFFVDLPEFIEVGWGNDSAAGKSPRP